MKKVLIFNGSPRRKGNTTALINHFVSGTEINKAKVEHVFVDELNLNYCCGCLRCNMIGRCGKPGDDWEAMVEKMESADVIVFASPIYFHHITAQLKKLIDRFRSLVHVQITGSGLIHTPVKKWNKELVVMFTMGSPDDADAQPAIEMFEFINEFLSPDKPLHVIKSTRLAVVNQLDMTKEELNTLYGKMKIDQELVEHDYLKNRLITEMCFNLGVKLTE